MKGKVGPCITQIHNAQYVGRGGQRADKNFSCLNFSCLVIKRTFYLNIINVNDLRNIAGITWTKSGWMHSKSNAETLRFTADKRFIHQAAE